MSITALVLLAVAAGGGLLLTAIGERVRPAWGGGLLTLVLAGAAVLAWRAHGTAPAAVQAGYVVGTLAAIAGGGPVASAVLRAADPTNAATAGGPADPEVLRGGAWVGVLERAWTAVILLAGWPEGLAILVAVKGLGRYAELKAPAAAERFIIGTLASLLWAAACVGVILLLHR
jgi:hypothetical protein